MTAKEIQELLNRGRQSKIDFEIIADEQYAQPTLSWLTGDFFKFYQDVSKMLGVGSYGHYWDCDDFASLYRVLAQVCHARTGTRQEAGIAVGEIYYFSEKMACWHAINFAVVSNEIIYLEPQTGQAISLSPVEKESIWMYRI